MSNKPAVKTVVDPADFKGRFVNTTLEYFGLGLCLICEESSKHLYQVTQNLYSNKGGKLLAAEDCPCVMCGPCIGSMIDSRPRYAGQVEGIAP